MKARLILGIVASGLALAAVCGCSSTSKTEGKTGAEAGAEAKACCAKCGPGCKCGGKAACCAKT